MSTFSCDEDYQVSLDLIAEWCGERGVEVWAYSFDEWRQGNDG